jgi:hypothetical protein
LGEGWSDFFAISFLTGKNVELDAPVSIGSYLVQRPRGVRAYPYSTDLRLNPLTFGDIQFNTDVHWQGTVWCAMLWEIRQAMIERYGFDAGRTAAERLIIDGLKMTPVSPLFTDARDALVLADQITNGGANQELLWKAFAKRGLGASALTSAAFPGSGFRIAAVEAYDLPPAVTPGAITVNSRSNSPAVQYEPLPIVVSDRDLQSLTSITVIASNLSTGASKEITLTRTRPGRFAGAIKVMPPGSPQEASAISAQPGEIISIAYLNEKGGDGGLETLEVRATAGRRHEVFAEDFEEGLSDWIFPPNEEGAPNRWHLTARRASSGTHSLYFARRKGPSESKSFTEAFSRGTAQSAEFDAAGLINPRIEFDYFFSGLGALGGASDVLTVLGDSVANDSNDPRFSLTYDIKPSTDGEFQRASIDLRFAEGKRAVLSFVFTASEAKAKRKQFEGFYLDRIRVTAISTER